MDWERHRAVTFRQVGICHACKRSKAIKYNAGLCIVCSYGLDLTHQQIRIVQKRDFSKIDKLIATAMYWRLDGIERGQYIRQGLHLYINNKLDF